MLTKLQCSKWRYYYFWATENQNHDLGSRNASFVCSHFHSWLSTPCWFIRCLSISRFRELTETKWACWTRDADQTSVFQVEVLLLLGQIISGPKVVIPPLGTLKFGQHLSSNMPILFRSTHEPTGCREPRVEMGAHKRSIP
jgi:hypothetical protein